MACGDPWVFKAQKQQGYDVPDGLEADLKTGARLWALERQLRELTHEVALLREDLRKNDGTDDR